MRLPTLLILPALVIATAARPAAAQNVISQLLAASRRIEAENGFVRVDWQTGALNDGRYDDVSATNLYAHTTYRIVGVCDDDCDDLDIQVVNRFGRVVAEDLLSDDNPVVTFTTGAGSAYTIRVIMASCSVNPCSWGLNLYRRDTSSMGPSRSVPLIAAGRTAAPLARAARRPIGTAL